MGAGATAAAAGQHLLLRRSSERARRPLRQVAAVALLLLLAPLVPGTCLLARGVVSLGLAPQALEKPRTLRGVKSGSLPPRTHRPYGAPFAISMNEFKRRPLYSEKDQVSGEHVKHVEALHTGDVEERRAAVVALWRNCTEAKPEIMQALCKAVLDDDFTVRWDACRAFEKLGKVDTMNTDPWIARLAKKLQNNETAVEWKILLADALGRIGTPAHAYSRAVGSNLEHEDVRVRLVSVEAIGRLGPQARLFQNELIRLKRDDYEEVRHAAEAVLFTRPKPKPGWMLTQRPNWMKRVQKSVRNKKHR